MAAFSGLGEIWWLKRGLSGQAGVTPEPSQPAWLFGCFVLIPRQHLQPQPWKTWKSEVAETSQLREPLLCPSQEMLRS